MIQFTEEEKAFLKSHIPGHHHRETAEVFSRQFRSVTASQVKSYAGRNKILTGYQGGEGISPWNKGRSYHAGENAARVQFKKGHIPHNTRPVGSERIERDGFVLIKTADPDKWEPKQRIIWQQANRQLKKNEIVIFLDGNKQNFDLTNLRCISRRIIAVINHLHLTYCDNETFDAACMTAELYMAIAKAKKQKKEMKKSGRTVKYRSEGECGGDTA